MFSHQNGNGQPRLLILEEDEDVLRVMVKGLGRDCLPDPDDSVACAVGASGTTGRCCGCSERSAPCVRVIESLRDLYDIHLGRWDLFICASAVPDGSGLDALAYARGTRPDLPVILTGSPGESALAVEAIRAGAADFLLTTGNNLLSLPLAIEKCIAHHRIKHENERLHLELSRSVAETALKNRQLESLIDQLETMARTDELTGLCNRRWFNLMLERVWAEALRSGQPLAFAMMDLDGFKAVNDLRGHQRGDELLRLAGRVIQANSRSVDLPARYGGDEFCILMPHTHVEEAGHVMERINHAFAAAMEAAGEDSRRITMSAGISHIQVSRPANPDQLVLHADEALYAAKSAGKSRIMIREPRQARPYGVLCAAEGRADDS